MANELDIQVLILVNLSNYNIDYNFARYLGLADAHHFLTARTLITFEPTQFLGFGENNDEQLKTKVEFGLNSSPQLMTHHTSTINLIINKL